MGKNMFKKREGDFGEAIACDYLTKQGYKIIDRNFRIRGGEIDIIAIENGTLAFVEVKTRSSSAFGSPLEAITSWKLRSLIKTAQFYKSKHPELPESMRIDAVAILLNNCNNMISIEVVKNISS
jgi:putative endonuclease